MLIRRRKVRVEIEQTRVEIAIGAPAPGACPTIAAEDATAAAMESPTAGTGATNPDHSSLTTKPSTRL